MKKQLNLLTPDQVSNVQTIVGDLENKKKTMVFRVLNITDNNKDLKAVVQQKVDKPIKLTYEQKHLDFFNVVVWPPFISIFHIFVISQCNSITYLLSDSNRRPLCCKYSHCSFNSKELPA